MATLSTTTHANAPGLGRVGGRRPGPTNPTNNNDTTTHRRKQHQTHTHTRRNETDSQQQHDIITVS
eukprot:4015381-Lingulodinium_polyedra.AAC.1